MKYINSFLSEKLHLGKNNNLSDKDLCVEDQYEFISKYNLDFEESGFNKNINFKTYSFKNDFLDELVNYIEPLRLNQLDNLENELYKVFSDEIESLGENIKVHVARFKSDERKTIGIQLYNPRDPAYNYIVSIKIEISNNRIVTFKHWKNDTHKILDIICKMCDYIIEYIIEK